MANEEYEELDKLAIAIYLDYQLNRFPIDVMALSRNMGIQLIPYSAYEEDMELLKKKSRDGFYCPRANKPMILYNDRDFSERRIRVTIGHEIKHYVCEDTEDNPEKDPLATHFGRYLLCPTPILIYLGIDDVYTIMEMFDIGYEASGYALRAAENRRLRYKDRIFEYEKPLIELFKWMKEDS